MAIYTRKSLFKDYITFIETLPEPACVEALDWCKDIDSKTPNCTFGQGIDALTDSSWAVWCLDQTIDSLDDETRKGFISKISDPMQAFSLYCGVKNLTATDDIDLLAKFEGRLPIAEKELIDGVVIREKDNIIGVG